MVNQFFYDGVSPLIDRSQIISISSYNEQSNMVQTSIESNDKSSYLVIVL